MDNKEFEKYLNQKGLDLVELPSENIKILDVLCAEDRSKLEEIKDSIFKNSFYVDYLGEIKAFFDSEKPLGSKTRKSNYEKWNYSTLSNKEAGASVSFISNAFKRINLSIKPEALFKQVYKTNLIFNEVELEEFSRETIGRFINNGKLRKEIHSAEKFKNGSIFIIYKTAKSKSISIELYDKNDDLIKIPVAMAGNSVQADGSAHNISEDETKINFVGTEKLVFAFKAMQLKYEGRYYKISNETQDTLKQTGLPEEIYDLIEPVTEIVYENEQKFLQALRKWLSEEQLNAHKHIFINYCVFDKFKTKDIVIKHRFSEDEEIAENPVFINYL
ncbi:MAG: hypothetical protein B6I20_04540 [Bacteroidetes bacterium 4572_117]|nr:MAG: hypothetical protein B6I20_04540 [Bacteroidetes bacterium 4572_117]